jgi:transposase-like protein
MGRVRTREIKDYDERIKVRIVEEVESGKYSQSEASRVYSISRCAIAKWLKIYGKLRTRIKIVKVVMQDEKEKIKELREALGDAHIKIRFYEKLLELGRTELGVDLKKSLNTTALEQLKKKA